MVCRGIEDPIEVMVLHSVVIKNYEITETCAGKRLNYLGAYAPSPNDSDSQRADNLLDAGPPRINRASLVPLRILLGAPRQ